MGEAEKRYVPTSSQNIIGLMNRTPLEKLNCAKTSEDDLSSRNSSLEKLIFNFEKQIYRYLIWSGAYQREWIPGWVHDSDALKNNKKVHSLSFQILWRK